MSDFRENHRFCFGADLVISSVWAGASCSCSSSSFIMTSFALPTSSSRLSCSSLADFSASSAACSNGLPLAATASVRSVCIRASLSVIPSSFRSNLLLNNFSRRVFGAERTVNKWKTGCTMIERKMQPNGNGLFSIFCAKNAHRRLCDPTGLQRRESNDCQAAKNSTNINQIAKCVNAVGTL